MRELILTGGPWSAQQQANIIAYCESDALALERLLVAMLPGIDLPRALLRGRYMAAAAAMEHSGVPIDMEMLALLRANWLHIQDQLIAAMDSQYGVFDGRTFKADRFGGWLATNNIPWPRLESGRLDLDDDAFRRWRAPIPRSRHCGSYAARLPNCVCQTWRSVAMAATARSCLRLGLAPGGTAAAIPGTSSGRRCGCEA